MFGGVKIDGFLLAAVDSEVGLLISGEVEATEREAFGDGVFPDGGEDGSARSVDLPGAADVEREESHAKLQDNRWEAGAARGLR